MIAATPRAGPMNAELQALDRIAVTAVFTADGTVLRPNANFLKLFGYRTRELVGRPHALLMPDDAPADADASLWAALRRGEVQSLTAPRRRRDGQRVWLRAAYTPITDAEGRVVEVVLFAIDFTAEQGRAAEDRGQLLAMDRSHAVVHFTLDGTITHANDRFLEATGFSRDEVVGAHHRLIVDPADTDDAALAAFWRALAEGRSHSGTFRRRGRHQRECWLHATYTPLPDLEGFPAKVVLCATDVTAERAAWVEHQGHADAIDKSHGVITFDMNGTVLDANENFLAAMGYRADEVEGRHHRMFVEPSYAHGAEYAAFWDDLAHGRHRSGEYRRVGKRGREVWLHASYNPIRDTRGRLVKVVKYATDITREKLRQADHQGQIAAIHKVQCVISFGLDGTVLDANDNFLDATGYRLSEVRGRHHRIFVDPETAASPAYATFWEQLARGCFQSGEFVRLRKDGQEVWLQASYNPIFDMQGRPFKVVKYAVDVTRERLRQLDHEGQSAAIRKSQCVVEFDLDGVVLDANDNFLAAMGYTEAEVVGRHHRMFVDADVASSGGYEAFWQTMRSGRHVAERSRRIGKGGREVWLQATYNPILDLHGRPSKIVKIAADVTQSVRLAQLVVSAREQAEHDPITGLPNRLRLDAYLADALDRPSPRLAVLYLDLDHFKPVNDTFGHAIGDEVLRTTAARLRGTVRAEDMVARVGGDEFVVAAPNLSDDDIDALCRRLIEVVKAPITHADRSLAVGLSIGVAVSPDDAATAEDLLRCADIALYRTKGNGRDGYSCFAVSMHERLSAGRHIAEEMRHGVQTGQFGIEYWPHFDVRTRALVGVEARLHWHHPARGRLEEAEFLTVAERSALVVPLGEWLLRAACGAAADWPSLRLVVGVSPVQVAGTDLATVIASALAESGLAPERLKLAMPETVLQAPDPERLRVDLLSLKALGVRLLLDGAGSRAVSLASLEAFAFDEVGADSALVADFDAEAGGGRLTHELRQLGEALETPTTAGGVPATAIRLVLDLRAGGRLQGLRQGTGLSAAEVTRLLDEPARRAAISTVDAAAWASMPA